MHINHLILFTITILPAFFCMGEAHSFEKMQLECIARPSESASCPHGGTLLGSDCVTMAGIGARMYKAECPAGLEFISDLCYKECPSDYSTDSSRVRCCPK